MGILDTLKKALDKTGKVAQKLTIQDAVKYGQGVSDKIVKEGVLEPLYQASQKRLEQEEIAKAQGTPLSGVAKAASFIPGVSLATNPFIESKLQEARGEKKASAGRRAGDVAEGALALAQPAMSAAFALPSAIGTAAGDVTKELTGTDWVQKASELASKGAQAGARKALSFVPGLTEDERDRLSKSGGELGKLALELLGAKGAGKLAGKAGVTGTLGQAASQAAGMTAADLSLASASGDKEATAANLARGGVSSLLANALPVGPSGKGKKKPSDIGPTKEELRAIESEKSSVPAEAPSKFNPTVAKVEAARESTQGVRSATRNNPNYDSFWKEQDAKKPVSAEEDYYAKELEEAPAKVEPVNKNLNLEPARNYGEERLKVSLNEKIDKEVSLSLDPSPSGKDRNSSIRAKADILKSAINKDPRAAREILSRTMGLSDIDAAIGDYINNPQRGGSTYSEFVKLINEEKLSKPLKGEDVSDGLSTWKEAAKSIRKKEVPQAVRRDISENTVVREPEKSIVATDNKVVENTTKPNIATALRRAAVSAAKPSKAAQQIARNLEATAAPVVKAEEPVAAPVAKEPVAAPVAKEPVAAPVAEEPVVAPVAETKPAVPKMENYGQTREALDQKSYDRESTFRAVPFTTSGVGVLSSRVGLNKVRVTKGNRDAGLGDEVQAIVESRAPEARRLMDVSGISEPLDFAINAVKSAPAQFKAAYDGLIAAMRSSKLRDQQVGNESGDFTFGRWADVLEAERASQDRSYIPFGQDSAIVRDVAVLDAAIARMRAGGSASSKALNTVLDSVDPIVRDTMTDLSVGAQNAGRTMSQAGGDFLVSVGKLKENELNPDHKHDYVPESLFESYKEQKLADPSVPDPVKEQIKAMGYQDFLAGQVDPSRMTSGVVDALSPLLKEKVDAKNLHMPGDVARVIHQADRLAAVKQNQEAFNLAQAAAASDAGAGVRSTWEGQLRGIMGLGDANVTREPNEVNASKAFKVTGEIASRYLSPIIMFGRLRPFLQAAYTSVATVGAEALSNPVAFMKNFVNLAKAAAQVSSSKKFSDTLQRYGIVERDVDVRASAADKARGLAFEFGGKLFDQQAKKVIALAAISDLAGKPLSPEKAAVWLDDKMRNATSIERANIVSDLLSRVTRLSDHTSGARSGLAFARNPVFSLLKSYSRNSFGRAVNSVQNALDAYANRKVTGNKEAYSRAMREMSYPVAMYVGGPLVALGLLKAVAEAQASAGQEVPSDEVLAEQAFNLYNMSLADGSADAAIQQAAKEAFGLVSPSGFTSLVDQAAGMMSAAKSAYSGDYAKAASELLKATSFGRMLDESFGRDQKGSLRFDGGVAATLGLPTSSQAAEKIARSKFAQIAYGDKESLQEAGRSVIGSFLGRTIASIYDRKFATDKQQEQSAAVSEAKSAAAKDLAEFMKSGDKMTFSEYLRQAMPGSVKYDPSEFAALMYDKSTGKAKEGSVLARVLEAMPQSYRDPAYVGDFGAYLRDLAKESPENLQAVAEAIAAPIAEHAMESANVNNPEIEAKFKSSAKPTGATSRALSEEFDMPEFASDASYKTSVAAKELVGQGKVSRDWKTASSKLNGLVAAYQADPSLWKSVGPSVSSVVAAALLGQDGANVLEEVRSDPEKYPSLYDALKGRLKYLSGPAGDAVYRSNEGVDAKPETGNIVTDTKPSTASGKVDIKSLLDSAVWNAADKKKKDKKPSNLVPVSAKLKSAFRPSSPLRDKKSSNKVLDSLYKALAPRRK